MLKLKSNKAVDDGYDEAAKAAKAGKCLQKWKVRVVF
jgi:hypothetical protein